MADTNNTNLTYVSVIQGAIDSFDSIWGSLKAKGVWYKGEQINTASFDTNVPTSDYSSLINQLSRITITDKTTGVKNNFFTTAPAEIEAYDGSTFTTDYVAQYSADDNKYYYSAKINNAGYYTADSVIDFTIIAKEINFTGMPVAATDTTHFAEGIRYDKTADHYLLTPTRIDTLNDASDTPVIGEVKIKRGTATLSLKNENITTNLSSSGEINVKDTGSIVNATKTIAEGKQASDYYTIVLDETTSLSGTVSAANPFSLTGAGFITSEDITITYDKDEEGKDIKVPTKSVSATENAVESTIYIPKAAISGLKLSGSATVDATNSGLAYKTTTDMKTATAEEKALYTYEVKPSGQFSVDKTNISISAGYVKEAADINVNLSNDAGSNLGDSIFIKAGNVGTAATNEITTKLDGGTFSENGTVLSATVTQAEDTAQSIGIESGYILANAVPVKVKSSSKTVSLNKAAISVTGLAPDATVTPDSIFKTGAGSTGDYKITIVPTRSAGTATVTNTDAFTYINKNDVTDGSLNSVSITGDNTGTTQTYHVKGSSYTPALSLVATPIAGTEINDGPEAGTEEKDGETVVLNLFKDSISADEKKSDYYEIVADVTNEASFTAGYVSSIGTATPVTKYIPKATFAFVEDGKGEEAKKFIQVTKGGYIPSGVIDAVGFISGTPDYAEVSLALTNVEAGLLTGAAVDGYYSLTVAKTSATDAGYISATEGQGSVALNTDAKIKKGTVTGTGSHDAVTSVEISDKNAEGADLGYYKVGFSKSTTFNMALTEGYIKAADLVSGIKGVTGTLNEDSKTLSLTLTDSTDYVRLEKARFTTDTAEGNTVAVKAESANISLVSDVANNEKSKYYTVTVGINDEDNGNKVNIKTTTEGYTKLNDLHEVAISSAPQTYYVLAGTALTNVAGSDSSANNTLGGKWDSTKNKYVVSLASYSIPVSGTLATGYYVTTEQKTVSGSATVTAKSLEIDKAVATLNTSISLGLSNALETVDETAFEGENALVKTDYIEIKPTLTSISVGLASTGFSAGYLNSNTDITGITAANQVVDSTTVVSQYVKKYKHPSNLEESEITETKEVYKVTIGEKSSSTVEADRTAARVTTLNTEASYASNDIEVVLHPWATGSDVYADLIRLQNRMNGVLTTASAD